MTTLPFEELRVDRLAEELADAVWNRVARWAPFEKNTLGKQWVRAADSIGANLAEGSGRGSYPDNRRFVRMARGSLNETRHWLRRAFRRNLLQPEDVETFKTMFENLGPTLNAYLRSIGTTKPTTPPNECRLKTNDQ